jgi:SAM-dependent methyltransferase
MSSNPASLEPTDADLVRIYRAKYSRFGVPGWGPRMRLAAGYFTPDDYYEAVVAKLVSPGCNWADIGCGRDIFPQHPDLARELSQRAGFVYGIDPDDNVKENAFLHDRFHGMVEDCDTERVFDIVTMRMVAEHIVDPDRAVQRIATLLKPGGRLVVYTPYKWAPMSVIAEIVPFRFHHPLKRLIWDAEARDTFPTAYRLNTRKDLAFFAGRSGLSEELFCFLDDCRVLSRYRVLSWCEIRLRSFLHALHLHYPEKCILGIYGKAA